MAKRKHAKSQSHSHNGSARSQFGELPPDVKIINLSIPVYVGRVKTDRPLGIDQISFRLLSEQQRVGINRVFAAVERLGLRDDTLGPQTHYQDFPPFMRTRAESARWVFKLIHDAVQTAFGIADEGVEEPEPTPGPSQ